MTSHIRVLRVMMIAAVMMMLTSITGVNTALGQPTFANPPCLNVKVRNFHPTCSATFIFATSPPGAWPATFTVPPGGSFGLPNPAPGVTIIGFFDASFAFLTLNPPPPTITGCGPTGWWKSGVSLSPGCTFNICVEPDPSSCNITVY